ncbi:MAG: TRAP transporter small permease [Pseudomonas sp.]|nr:MAG: TRAP transporter small permease [Pseudomonas sp.]
MRRPVLLLPPPGEGVGQSVSQQAIHHVHHPVPHARAHVLNNTPTWAESLALLLVIYVTMFGVAVGVRDAGHIGLESFLVLAPDALRLKMEFLIHALVLVFGAAMAWNCAVLAESVWSYRLPTLWISEGWKYVPATIAGVLIVMFSIEHIIALAQGKEVEPAWA